VSDLPLVVVDDLHEIRATVDASPEELTPIGLREVVRGPEALYTLPDVLARCGVGPASQVTVLSDTTSKRYGDLDVLDVLDVALTALTPLSADVVNVQPDEGSELVLATAATVAAAIEAVRERHPDALVSVGSGTLVDIGKVVAHTLSIPHVVVQTAASVNGFADNQSVLLIDGVKRTTPSQWPTALVIDPWVVAEAPCAMTRAGLGDELSMFTAGADWYLSNAVGIDTSYSSTITSMMRVGIDDLLEGAGDVGRGDQRAVNDLASLLTVSGIAMGVAGRTAPSSGAEHLVSHLLDMDADAVATTAASHGSQVGVSSIFASLVWQRVRDHLRVGDASFDVDQLAEKEQVLAAFSHLDPSGATAEECWRDYERKARWIRGHQREIAMALIQWDEHDKAIAQLLAPTDVLVSALRRAQAPITFSQLDPAPKPDVVFWAVANGHRMRERFTVFDLAELLGLWGEDAAAEVLSELQGLAQ
jgi:glycerol-1-phosphate dehydrogenase [NAD(P)+]